MGEQRGGRQAAVQCIAKLPLLEGLATCIQAHCATEASPGKRPPREHIQYISRPLVG